MNESTMAIKRVGVGVALVVLGIMLGGFLSGVQGAIVDPVQHTINFTQQDISFTKHLEYDMVRFVDCGYLSERGHPMLPFKEIRIALPAGMKALSVSVVASELEEISGDYYVYPAQPPVRIGQDSNQPFIDPISAVYSSPDHFPSQPVSIVSQTDLAGQAMAIVQVCPLKYIPAERKLYIYTSLTLSVEGVDGYVCNDYLPANASENVRRTYEQMATEMVVNREAVELMTFPGGTSKGMLLDDGPYEHVIITSGSYAALYQPLVDWHIKKGVKDTVVTTNYIYAVYSGSDNQEKIRNFVIDAHANWSTQYILIGGEHNTVPFEYRIYNSDNIPSDEYYGDFDDDWTYEVYVGRTTAEGSTQINCFIDKVLKYEIDPPTDDYALNACLLGMDLTLASEPPHYTLTRSEDLKESIDATYIPSRFHVTTVYDTESTNHKTKFLNALSAGQNLVNHSDHSNYFCMGTGDLNHNSAIYSSDVNSLTNNNKMCNIFSLGCHPMELDHNDCIAEAFVINNPLQGAVSFTGNTRSGWFYVGYPVSLSGELDLYWWRGLFTYNKYRLGEALAWTKNNCSHTGDMTYCHWTLNLLGEPEMPLWTDSIRTMVVTHSGSFPIGASSFAVHVEDEGSIPLSSAYVCLWKGDEVYARDYTDASGNLSLDVNSPTLGDMFVTVTLQNYLPYQGLSECTGNMPPVSDFTWEPPTPTHHDTIQFTSSSYDTDGWLTDWQWDFGDDSTATGEQVTHVYGNHASYMVTLIVEDNLGVCDTSQQEVVVTFICGDVDDDGSQPNIADLTYLVAYLFTSGPPPPVIEAANIDGVVGSGGPIDIADLTYLVAYLFTGGPAPVC
ncbi:MAG: PKD domain-containing protein [candidate division Zixibacteria bacterium]|nr:PKD domain-containing protein [candidate division Zixibacteria bacterium]